MQIRALLIGVPLAPIGEPLRLLLEVNFAMLGWRLAMRCLFVTRAYGWREGLASLPRILLSNLIAMWAAQRAVYRYLTIRRTGVTTWDKTAHRFPAEAPAE